MLKYSILNVLQFNLKLELEKWSTNFHLLWNVSGRMRAKANPFDLPNAARLNGVDRDFLVVREMSHQLKKFTKSRTTKKLSILSITYRYETNYAIKN